MAGKGFPAANGQVRVLPLVTSTQPDLPLTMPDGACWPPETVAWWQAMAQYPLAADWTAIEWFYHMDTAVLHGKFWLTGSTSAAAELRLRLAKIGATAEDRARLRITFAAADAAESGKPSQPKQQARERFEGLRAVPDAEAGAS